MGISEKDLKSKRPITTQGSVDISRSRTIAALFTAVAVSPIPLSVGSLWFTDVKSLLYVLTAVAILLLALALVLLVFLPIHVISHSKYNIAWWLYPGLGTAYSLIIFLSVGGAWSWQGIATVVACGFSSGWAFRFMIIDKKPVWRLAFSLSVVLICLPVFTFLGSIALTPVRVWLGTEIVHQEVLPDGASMQVVKVPNGSPTGPSNHFELRFRTFDGKDFSLVYHWDRPPGLSDVELAQISSLFVVIPPGRDALIIPTKTGHWKPFKLDRLIQESAPDHPGLFTYHNHQPVVTLLDVTPNAQTIKAKVDYFGGFPQTATLRLDPSTNELEIANVVFPEDPRLNYFQTMNLQANCVNVRTIVRDMDNDRLPEILVSHASVHDNQSEGIWHVYKLRNNAYYRIDSPLTIADDTISHWTPSGDN